MKGLTMCRKEEQPAAAGVWAFPTSEQHVDEHSARTQISPYSLNGTTRTHLGTKGPIPRSRHKDRPHSAAPCPHSTATQFPLALVSATNFTQHLLCARHRAGTADTRSRQSLTPARLALFSWSCLHVN